MGSAIRADTGRLTNIQDLFEYLPNALASRSLLPELELKERQEAPASRVVPC